MQAVDDSQAPDPSEINIEAHFAVVDSFDMPPVHFDPVRGGFTTAKGKGSIAGQASSRAAFLRERWGIIKEVRASSTSRIRVCGVRLGLTGRLYSGTKTLHRPLSEDMIDRHI